jgi:hypothetical protein
MLDLISIGGKIAKRPKSAALLSMPLKTGAPANSAFQNSPDCLLRSVLSSRSRLRASHRPSLDD